MTCASGISILTFLPFLYASEQKLKLVVGRIRFQDCEICICSFVEKVSTYW